MSSLTLIGKQDLANMHTSKLWETAQLDFCIFLLVDINGGLHQ